MNGRTARPLSLAFAAASALACSAQTYKLKTVGSADGLTNPFVHAIAQDATGRLWIGTGQGAGRYDGRRVTMFTTADSLAEDFVSSIHPAADGSIWFGHNEGGISHYANGVFHKISTGGTTGSSINAIIGDGRGGIWAAAQNAGIIHVSGEGVCRPGLKMDGVLWYSLLPLDNGSMVAGASDGLHLLKPGPDGQLAGIGDLSAATRAPVHSLARSASGRIFAGTESDGVVAFNLAGGTLSNASTLGGRSGLAQLQVRDMAMGAYGQLIIGTFGQGAYEIELKGDTISSLLHYGSDNGLGTDNVGVVYTDSENNLWFARFGAGLARLLDRAVVYFAAAANDAQDVRAIAFRGREVWFGIRGAVLHALNNDMRRMDTLYITDGPHDEEITALLAAADGRLWAGTADHGLLRQDARGTFRPVATGADRLSRQIHALAALGGETWVATGNGVYVIGPSGTRHLTTENGLPHNAVNALYADASGRMWMACNNGGVSFVAGDEVKSFTLTEQGNAFHVTGIAQDSSGTTWFSTTGNGVRYLRGDSVMGIGAAQGLRSDYCYAMARDGHGNIWAGHRGGASKIDRKTLKVRTYDRQFGMEPDRRMNTVVSGPDGNIWFGTDKGVLRYDAGKDIRTLRPPTVLFTDAKVSGRDVPVSVPIELGPDIYRIQFDFLGTSLKDPDAVRYRYKLEGHDIEWTETAQNSAYYMRITDGKYTFLVQAAVAGGDFTGNTARLGLTVQAPVWKRPWFIGLCGLALLLTVLGSVHLRERRQRLARELLTRRLDERTLQLRRKTDELEAKNKDITDSITYARRIQQAILPPQAALTGHFPNSFILYKPRDIVSGDFYWFRRFGRKFILACADCTGHGVPGAFMSMIGSMLLREVSADKEVHAPDMLLGKLDKELRTVLQYQTDDQSSHDGMDISLCELDLGSRLLRASAAMHDLLILRDGKVVRKRGTRQSIGGVISNGAGQAFGMIEVQLEPGDRLFILTDGMPDQFGGKDGKKLKVSGLTAWIEGTAHLTMAQQAGRLGSLFDEWMEGRDQVDDVLLIGVET